MTPEPQRYDSFAGEHAATVVCPTCSAQMLRGMRFCRSCGFRLGEGLDEYVETMRLDGMPQMSATPPGAPKTARAFGAATTSLAPQPTAGGLRRRRPRRACGAGMGWV